MPWLRLRDVLTTVERQDEIADARRRYPRFDQIWEGIVWLFARDPEPMGSFESTVHQDIRYLIYGFRGDAVARIPDMWIFYEYDDSQVRIHGINANDAPEDEEG
jgi:hypothetical protein